MGSDHITNLSDHINSSAALAITKSGGARKLVDGGRKLVGNLADHSRTAADHIGTTTDHTSTHSDHQKLVTAVGTPPAVDPTTPSSFPTVTSPASSTGGKSEIEFATPLEDDEDRLDVYYNDEPLRYRMMANILGDQSASEEVERLFTQLHLTHVGEPTTYAEAQGDPAWRAVMEQELKSVEQNRTWELVPLSDGHRPITLKWVFKLKKDEQGAVIKHKARLVERGFVKQEGIDYNDAVAPVARMESVRVLLALAAQEGWKVHHMDVKSAFLNGDLKEEVYMC